MTTGSNSANWAQALHGWEQRRAQDALRSLPELHDATEAEMVALQRYTKLLTLPRYGHLWRKGAPMMSFYVLLSGKLSSKANKEGTSRVMPAGAQLAGGAWLEDTVCSTPPVCEEASVLLWVRASDAMVDPALKELSKRMAERAGLAWKVELLKAVPFFTDLVATTLRRLAPLFSTSLVKKGTVLIEEGAQGDNMFVLVEGACSITKWFSDKGRAVEVAKVTQDSEHTYFGELALFEKKPRTASVVAQEACFLLILQEASFAAFMSLIPDFRRRVEALKEYTQQAGRRPTAATHLLRPPLSLLPFPSLQTWWKDFLASLAPCPRPLPAPLPPFG